MTTETVDTEFDFMPLEEFLAEYPGEPNTEDGAAPTFAVDTEERAIWASRKLRSIAKQIAQREATAAREIEKVQVWLESANANLHRARDYFEDVLTFYHETELRADAKKKTIKLPGLELKARKKPTQWEFDEEKFIPWAHENAPDLVRVAESIDKAAAKKMLTPDEEQGVALTGAGNAVNGVVVMAGTVDFSVKLEPGYDG